MKEKILKLNDIRSRNLQAVLEILLESEGLSRTEIARRMGCDNTTVSRAVRELIARKILMPGEKAGSEHGRPREKLLLDPAGPALAGISLEAERITGVVTDLRGEIRAREQIVFPAVPGRGDFLAAVSRVIRAVRAHAGERLAGTGAAVFGSYGGPDFTLENAAALPALNGLALRPFLEAETGGGVAICDHLVAKMAFLTRNFPEFCSGSVMLISSGSGIGSLISEQGRFLFVRNNHGGELGHSICVPGGLPCGCGRKGCLETVASIRALLRVCREKLGEPGLGFDGLCRLFRSCDAVVTEETEKAARFLGTAIANQLNSCPVDRLVVTGRMLELGQKFQDMLERVIRELVFSPVRADLAIHFIRLDFDNSLARGAAIFAGRTPQSGRYEV